MTADRRLIHVFVSDERRSGPHERRGAEIRHLESMRERQKIERIRAFKQKGQSAQPATPMVTKKRLTYLCLGLLLLIAAALLLN
ncbi:hypothetical protein [Desulfosarcina sp.]|uniref:hypothetical protein n=1 Tax=Desulfosarcina sp. TaxID=2027861 RepID=UPI003970CCE2